MASINVGVVGAGHIGASKHIPSYLKHPSTNLVAVCDKDNNQLNSLSSLKSSVNTYNTLETMINSHDLDILGICTPPQFHYEHIKKGLKNNIHILVEKPLTYSLEETEGIKSRLEKSNSKLSVVHHAKFNPGVLKARKKLKSEIKNGNIEHVHCSYNYSNRLRDPNHWENELKGGHIGESLPHRIYTTYQFLNEMTCTSVNIQSKHPEPHYTADKCDILLSGDGSASIHLNYAAESNNRYYIVQTTDEKYLVTKYTFLKLNKSLVNQLKTNLSELASVARSKVINKTPIINSNQNSPSEHYIVIDKFIDYVVNGASPPTHWEEAYNTMELTDEIGEKIDSACR